MPPRILWLTAGILALGAGGRLWALGDLTPGVWYDEAVNAIDARLIVQDGFPVFFVGNNGREPLFIYSLAASFKLFGHNTLALRFVSMAAGLITVAVTFALVRSIWGVRPALISTALLATSVWPLILSRLGMRTALMPLLLSAAVFWLWTGMQKRSAWRTALGGVFFGLAAYSYTAVRVAPVWILVFCVLWLAVWRRSNQLTFARSFGLVGAFCLASLITVAPLATFFLRDPGHLVTRLGQESILNAESNQFQAFGNNFTATLGMLSLRGDANARHNLPGKPVFDPPLTVFAVTGLAVIVARYRRPESLLALLWLTTMLLPGILSKEAPHQLRTAGIIPIVYVFPAVGLATVAGWIARVIAPRRAAWAYGLMALLLIWSIGNSTRAFLIEWAESQDTADAFLGAQRIAGDLVRDSGQTSTAIFATPIYRGEPASSLVFSRDVGAEEARFFSGRQCLAIPSEGQLRYLLARDTGGPWEFPQMVLETHKTSSVVDKNGEEWVQVYELDANELIHLEPSRLLPAALGDQFRVLGYDLPKSMRASETSYVRVYLQVDKPFANQAHYQFLAHLVNVEDNSTPVLSHADSCLAGRNWKMGDRLLVQMPLILNADVEEGTHRLAFGIWKKFEDERLVVRDGAGSPIGDALQLGPSRIVDSTEPPPEPQQALDFRLGEAIGLTGFDRGGSRFEPGGTLQLTLYWEVLGSMEENYTVFVQVLDGDGQVVTQKDNYPQNGTYPTSIWNEQDPIVADNYELVLPAAIGKPPHRIIVGMYRLEDGSRLSIRDSNGDLVGDYVEISP